MKHFCEKGLDGGDWLLILFLASRFNPDAVPTWLWIVGWMQFIVGGFLHAKGHLQDSTLEKEEV